MPVLSGNKNRVSIKTYVFGEDNMDILAGEPFILKDPPLEYFVGIPFVFKEGVSDPGKLGKNCGLCRLKEICKPGYFCNIPSCSSREDNKVGYFDFFI